MHIKTRCPICGKPSEPLHKPFCSRGCRDRDLINWLDEGYKVPVPSDEQDSLQKDAD